MFQYQAGLINTMLYMKRKSIFNTNIFPAKKEYIESKHQNKRQDVEIAETLKQEIIESSSKCYKIRQKRYRYFIILLKLLKILECNDIL